MRCFLSCLGSVAQCGLESKGYSVTAFHGMMPQCSVVHSVHFIAGPVDYGLRVSLQAPVGMDANDTGQLQKKHKR